MTAVDSRWGSASLADPTMWWYTARSRLLSSMFADWLPAGSRVVDVGSADGPSVEWLAKKATVIAVDLDPRGLKPGGVRADALQLPFADAALDGVTAFDVFEHFEDDDALMAELIRVVKPGGFMLLSVPAYQWAWSHFDVISGHYRRYTKARLTALVERHGGRVARSGYLFSGTFPFFVVSRWLLPRVAGESAADGSAPRWLHRALLGLCRIDRALLERGVAPPFGSSVAAVVQVPD